MNSLARKIANLGILIKIFLSLFSLRRNRVMTNIFRQTRFDYPFTPSWSQAGEDLVLVSLISKQHGFYVDVGAHHPDRFSITRKLYERGWKGINVDANLEIGQLFTKKRKRDKFVGAAVGTRTEYQLSRFIESALSTTNEEWASRFRQEGNRQLDKVTVRGIRLNEVFQMIDQGQRIDLLNIDIEGSDFDALVSLDFPTLDESKKPEWLVLETSPPVSKALMSDSVSLAVSWGYEPIVVLPMVTILRRLEN